MNRSFGALIVVFLILLTACGEEKKRSAGPAEDKNAEEVAPGSSEPRNLPVPPAAQEKFELAEIEIQPRDDIRVHWLKEKQNRVIGRIDATIYHVAPELRGAKTTRIRTQLTPTYDIRVTKGGYLYALKGEEEDLKKTGREWESRPEDVKGAWLDDVHRTQVKAGDELHMSWFELSFIAGDIRLADWKEE